VCFLIYKGSAICILHQPKGAIPLPAAAATVAAAAAAAATANDSVFRR